MWSFDEAGLNMSIVNRHPVAREHFRQRSAIDYYPEMRTGVWTTRASARSAFTIGPEFPPVAGAKSTAMKREHFLQRRLAKEG